MFSTLQEAELNLNKENECALFSLVKEKDSIQHLAQNQENNSNLKSR